METWSSSEYSEEELVWYITALWLHDGPASGFDEVDTVDLPDRASLGGSQGRGMCRIIVLTLISVGNCTGCYCVRSNGIPLERTYNRFSETSFNFVGL
jgi:hypothetical protein